MTHSGHSSTSFSRHDLMVIYSLGDIIICQMDRDYEVISDQHDAERLPDMLKVAGVGATLGFFGAVGIYFAPGEPYPGYIMLAGTV